MRFVPQVTNESSTTAAPVSDLTDAGSPSEPGTLQQAPTAEEPSRPTEAQKEPLHVQRVEAVPRSVPSAEASSATSHLEVDMLVQRLYEPIACRLRAELRLARERAGYALDLRH
jgi:hypothetical protein